MNTVRWRTVRVARKALEAMDIASLELVDPDGGLLPPFTAGSHIDVRLGEGVVRSYSLCNPPDERHRYLLGVLRVGDGRGGSAAVHERIREGDLLQVTEPKNHFELDPGARDSLLIAGGIGVTPLLCMAERLATLGSPFEMHYCTRSLERTAFRARIASSPFAHRVRFHVDAQPEEVVALVSCPASERHLYVCGPPGFIDTVLGSARDRGWPDDRLHFEFFTGTATPLTDDGTFEVVLARSGRALTVPHDRTVVRVLAEAGVALPTSCEQGVCGTCLTRVIDGIPEHRDLFLTPAERARNDQFLPCCSRSRSARLVLDL